MSLQAKLYSIRAATWFALAGLALGVVLLFAMGLHDVLAEIPISIAVGGVAAIAIARWLAGVYASHIQRAALVPSALLGAVVALGSVTGGTLSGALVQVGIDWARGEISFSTPIDVLKMLFATLVWVLFIGGLPAVLLGCAFGLLVQRRGRQLSKGA